MAEEKFDGRDSGGNNDGSGGAERSGEESKRVEYDNFDGR